MPELPEVETVKNILNKIIVGKKITSIDVLREQTLLTDKQIFVSKLTNQSFKKVTRIGKFLVFHVTKKMVFLSHLRMEGKYFELDESEPNTTYSRVVFHLDNGHKLCYDDSRCFGIMKLSTEDNYLNEKEIANLGPEPFDITDVTELLEKTKKSNDPIKQVITDQSVMAGIGNIYADEILYACKIHPLTPAKYIIRDEWISIVEVAKAILKTAIRAGGSTIKSYHPGKDLDGKFQSKLKAYGKYGECCPKCGVPFNFIKVNGRGTTYCPHCQKKKGAPIRIAIVGKIASGKSTVLEHFKKIGYSTLSCDEVVKNLYKNREVIKQINALFGLNFVDEVNKQELRNYLATHRGSVQKINKLIHPLVIQKVEDYFKYTKNDFLVVEVPLLFEAKMESMFDFIIGVDITESKQSKRLLERNGSASKELKTINSNNQFDINKKRMDFVVKNTSTLDSLNNQLDEIISKLQEYLDLFPSLHLL